jgi:hypothetical protein
MYMHSGLCRVQSQPVFLDSTPLKSNAVPEAKTGVSQKQDESAEPHSIFPVRVLIASRKNLVDLCPRERQRGVTRNFAWLQLRRRVRPYPITFLAELQEGTKVFQLFARREILVWPTRAEYRVAPPAGKELTRWANFSTI